MNKFKLILATFSLLVFTGLSSLATTSVYAVDPDAGNRNATAAESDNTTTNQGTSAGKTEACEALKEIDATHGCGSEDTTVNRIIGSVVKVLSFIVGFVSVIMIIIAGFKYVTSGGDSGSVASAKTTLIYAIVGLVIVALAQIIVSTVLSGTIDSTKAPVKKTTSLVSPLPVIESGPGIYA